MYKLQPALNGFEHELIAEMERFKVLNLVQRMFGRPLSKVQIEYYSKFDCKIKLMLDLLGDPIFDFVSHSGKLAEFYIALMAELDLHMKFNTLGSDVCGGFYDRGKYESIQVEVRSSYTNTSQWTFKTENSRGEKLYNVLACVGYLELQDRSYNSRGQNPMTSHIYLIPVESIETKSIKMSKPSFVNRRPIINKYARFLVRDHSDIMTALSNFAHGKGISIHPQMEMEFDI